MLRFKQVVVGGGVASAGSAPSGCRGGFSFKFCVLFPSPIPDLPASRCFGEPLNTEGTFPHKKGTCRFSIWNVHGNCI